MMAKVLVAFLSVPGGASGLLTHRPEALSALTNAAPVPTCPWRSPVLLKSQSSDQMTMPFTIGKQISTTSRYNSFQSQELRILLDALKEARMRINDLDEARLREIESFALGLMTDFGSPVPPEEINQHLPGTEWRLAFSSHPDILRNVPDKVAGFLVEFVDDKRAKFVYEGRRYTFGAKTLASEGEWEFAASGALKLRSSQANDFFNSIQQASLDGPLEVTDSIYFDGDVWIATGQTRDGQLFSNIYLREIPLPSDERII